MAITWPLLMQLIAQVSEAPVETWDYENLSRWTLDFPLCGGWLQSPINLMPGRSRLNDDLTLQLAAGLQHGQIEMVNTGRTARFYFRPENRSEPIAQFSVDTRFGPLNGTYRFEHMDMHWGVSVGYDTGSEHSISGRFSDAEAQLVFLDTRYANMSQAIRHNGAVAIIGILLKPGEPDVKPDFPTFGIDPMIGEIGGKGDSFTNTTDLTEFGSMLRKAIASTYSYYGSLTYPPCSPVVNWMVVDRMWTVKLAFVMELNIRLYQDAQKRKRLTNNRRPIQETGTK